MPSRTRSAARPSGRRSGPARWPRLDTERLLEVRIDALGVRIEGTWMEPLVERVLAQLAARDLRLRPHFWLSDEWFSPDGVPGVAIPFYLAHPRLTRLEREQMLEVEGGTREQFLRLLRHEVGHAVAHGYKLRQRRSWQGHFGRSSTPYPERYRPNPRSKRYVQHLGGWYAQSHPDEDFAETFAVWLGPPERWRQRYAGWPALRKLEYVDELMTRLAGQPPKEHSRATPGSLSGLRHRLRTHYQRKRARYSPGYSDVYDRDLQRLFSADPAHRGRPTAASFLRRHRREIREAVAQWTGEYAFTLDQVLKDMTGRCAELKLRAVGPERRLKLDFAILLTLHSMEYMLGGREWHAL